MQTEETTPKNKDLKDIQESFINIESSIQTEKNETPTGKEAFCGKCRFILLKCNLLDAMYCEKCVTFFCSLCHKNFDKRTLCLCGRCTCCFVETCLSNQKIGKQCQNVCHTCYEENEPSSDNIVRYPCGHGICRICLFQHAIDEQFDPNYCYVCRE